MFSWESKPLEPPFVCALTRNGGDEVGPFIRTQLRYLEPFLDGDQIRVQPQVNTLYLSAQAIREMCNVPDSPLVAVSREAIEGQEAHIAEQAVMLGERDEHIERLEAELATLRAGQSSVDVEALASALVIPLKSHFAAKTGPKPKAAA